MVDGEFRGDWFPLSGATTGFMLTELNSKISGSFCSELSVEGAEVSPAGEVELETVVTVTCLKPQHYVLFGSRELTCQSTGWSDRVPECRKCGESDYYYSCLCRLIRKFLVLLKIC